MAQKFFTAIRARFFTTAADTAVDIGVQNDTDPRVAIDAGGKITWGDGNVAGDTNLYRSAANSLKTDDAFYANTLYVGNIQIDTASASNGQTLVYNGTKFAPAAGGSSAVDDDQNIIATQVFS